MATYPHTRRPIIGVTTKMYFSLAHTRSYIGQVLAILAEQRSILDRIDVFVCPDTLALPSVVSQAKTPGLPVLIGAQDCAADDSGAFTGFVSPAVLAECGARLVEVGHTERRRLLGETDTTTALKAAAAVRNGLIPIVCVGESEPPAGVSTEAELGASAEAAIATVSKQISTVLDALPDDAEVVLAYEPVWAIGAAQPASAAYVRAVVSGMRDRCAAIQRRGAARTRIIYGGGAGPGMFAQLEGTVDGLFLGRTGHDPEQFVKTAQEVADFC
ncbi:hypothetical protein SEPCBS119000_000606 [Sporothrix epigloea]|uniref:Triosephosphate isomerase n=1 Tax=Sporothrix epigloea TaxID=1892477 RepID=A0ABP0D7R8_9PEZI